MTARLGGRAGRLATEVLSRDRVVLAALLALAAALRLPGLESRAIFDADQGRDMLVLWNLVHHGQLPLLGPETISIVNSHLHHGALYWYLLAPAAWLGGGSPVAVVDEIALLGIAAVGATWWAGRVIGGRVVGLVAGLLLAVSPAGIEQSTFLWNPNPVPLFAALAVGAAWKAHLTGRARWYAVALGAAVAVSQLHLLGAVFVVAVLALAVVDLSRAARSDRRRVGAIVRGLAGGAVIAAILFLPLLASELQTDFAETRRLVDYLLHAGGGTTGGRLDPASALAFLAFRSIGWPFVGLVTDVPGPAAIVVAIWLILVAWALAVARGDRRAALAWLAATVGFSTVVLAWIAPGLLSVTPGLPTDHYHAFLNPIACIAVALAGVGLVDRARRFPSGRGARLLGSVLAMMLVASVGFALLRAPGPSTVATWPTARDTASQVLQLVGDRRLVLVGLPDFKAPDSIGFPLTYLGARIASDAATADELIVNCDDRFDTVMPRPCGGPAEDAAAAGFVAGSARSAVLVARIPESAVLSVSVYELRP